MENERKLYKFLLLNGELLQDDEFVEYNVKKIYRKLVNKYKPALSVLEYLKAYAQVAIEDLKKEGDTNIEDIQRKIDEVIVREKIEKLYIRFYVKAKTEDATETDKQMSEVMMKGLSAEQRDAIEQIYNYYYDIYKSENCINTASFYERLIRNIEHLEKIFFKTYAFHDLFDGKEWCGGDSKTFVQRLEKLAVILMKEKEPEDENDVSDMDEISEWIASKDDIPYDESGLINEVDTEILFGFSIIDALLNIYENYNLLSAKREKRKYRKNIQIGYEDKEAITELIGFLKNQIREIEECKDTKEYEERKKDLKLVEDVFVNFVKTYKKSRELELEYMANFISSDIDFMRYQKMIDKLEELIKVYNASRNTKYTKLETKEERKNDKLHRELNEKRRYNAFCEIVELYEAIIANKRTAMSKVTARLNKRLSQDSKAHNELIDIDLYKAIFSDLRKMINKEGEKFRKVADTESEDAYARIKDNANGFYIYNNIAIMTLTFPNTEISKYKKAAIIVDKKDITKIYLNSGKRCWTFKNGLECTHGVYESKTMKPDKITTNAGKLILLDTLMGVRTKKVSLNINDDEMVEQRSVYYTNSHKFDLRAEKIVENIEKSKSANEKNYYSGKIRIEKVGDLQDSNTVCFNNEQNDNDAAILYFDDVEKFKSFLNAL